MDKMNYADICALVSEEQGICWGNSRCCHWDGREVGMADISLGLGMVAHLLKANNN